MADFHRVVFEHKFAEAVSLLTSLGAKTMRVEHVTGWSSEFLGNLNVPVPNQPGQLGASVGQSSRENKKLLFSATLDGKHTPKLPKQLAWYPHEALWMSMANGRLEYGLKEFNMTVTCRDDYGIDATLSGLIKDAGLEIGGHFESHKLTIWNIEGSFGTAPLNDAIIFQHENAN